ncbi:MAG: CaiB/BaiF CoA-transferase family protein [Phenylobacterium sp.]|uniref:CaiB/BaiF CoA transferase family protein n=1 Tax=Phenylobacterium sp. TaxID=1871053 RepID=UPI002734C996|nr:CaiB/BaiF CoA-transferase family protein [Phenylobacterium sp.]MDP3747379.1 CaiB/BaiF CoA-transferase family protein [Phenylobacterium sp.]
MLEGLKVIELATHIAAPAAGGMLAEWGADVVKVENPDGDPIRRGFEKLSPDGESPAFQLDNRGKRSAMLDIRQPEGREALLRLMRGADVFLTNVRPGALKRAGIDWESVRAANPALIYASVTGYGLLGDSADLPGYDVAAFWSRSGVASLMTPKGEEPFPLRTGLGDHTCALATAAAILAAVVERSRTGRGRLVETSLLRSGVYAISSDLAVFLRLGRIASTHKRTETAVPLVNYYRSADGRWVCLMPRDRRTDWPKIATAAGRLDLIDDPRFRDDEGRKANTAALVAALDEGFGQVDYAELSRRLTEADLVWAPLQTPQELAGDPLAEAAGCFVEAPDGRGGSFRSPATPARFPGWEPVLGAPPSLGQHTAEVLAEAGLDPGQIARLVEIGAAL